MFLYIKIEFIHMHFSVTWSILDG